MLDTVRAWINGTREYNTGVQLYNILGSNGRLKSLLASGYSLYNNFKLQEEMLQICEALKVEHTSNSKIGKTYPAPLKPVIEQPAAPAAPVIEEPKNLQEQPAVQNEELHNASVNEAKKVYKEAMNCRAVVFSMIPDEQYGNVNRPDLVASRRELCLNAVKHYIRASELFDQADHVKQHGRLPDQQDPGLDEWVASLEDYQIKPALDNARKAFNKLKEKEQTPERLALMQNHQDKIKNLEERWHSLKQKK